MSNFVYKMQSMLKNRGMQIIIFGMILVWIVGMILWFANQEFWAWGVSLIGPPLILLLSLIDDLWLSPKAKKNRGY